MPWIQYYRALDEDDPRNIDRQDPGGDRLRVRINVQRGHVVDFSIQYESPDPDRSRGHREVVRSDGSHGPAHYHVFDRGGREIRQRQIPDHLDYKAAVQVAIEELFLHWRRYRRAFSESAS